MSDAQLNIEYVIQKKHMGWKYKLIIREMQMITTMKCYLTLARLAITQTEQWQRMLERTGILGTLHTSGGNVKYHNLDEKWDGSA